jgi:hypothetical protein
LRINIKSSIIVLFSVALLTGFISVTYTQPILALSPGDGGHNGRDGDRGDGGHNGRDGDRGDRGDGGHNGRDGDRGDRGDGGHNGRDGDRGDNGRDDDRGNGDDSGTTGQPIGFLNIKKNVVGDNKPASDFRLNIVGNNPSKTAISGSPDGVDVIVGEGYYKVTEQPINGYTATYSEGCEGDINMNPQREFCVVTNTATAKGSLKVSVHAIEEGCPFLVCPSPSPNDFQITVTGSGGQLYSFMGTSTKLIDPGTYTVRQQAPSGSWNVDFSEGCEGQISAGQLKTCIITNRGYVDP